MNAPTDRVIESDFTSVDETLGEYGARRHEPTRRNAFRRATWRLFHGGRQSSRQRARQ
jgi:hypothetical protein